MRWRAEMRALCVALGTRVGFVDSAASVYCAAACLVRCPLVLLPA